MSVFKIAQKVGALTEEDYARFKELTRYFRAQGNGAGKGKAKRKYTRKKKSAEVVVQKERKPRVKRGASDEIDHSPKRAEE